MTPGRPDILRAVLAAETSTAAQPDREYARPAAERLRALRGFLADPDTPPFPLAALITLARALPALDPFERRLARALRDLAPAAPREGRAALALAGAFLWWGARNPEHAWPEPLLLSAVHLLADS